MKCINNKYSIFIILLSKRACNKLLKNAWISSPQTCGIETVYNFTSTQAASLASLLGHQHVWNYSKIKEETYKSTDNKINSEHLVRAAEMDEVDREEARNPDFDEIEEEKISNKFVNSILQISENF